MRSVAGALFLAVVVSVVAHATPPVVVKLVPEDGALDVSGDTAEIRITFDQDMNHEGYSICGGGEFFPEIQGRGKWEDARTLVLSVALEPSHVYSYGINSPRHQGFRDVSGEPAEVRLVRFRTAGKKSGDHVVEMREANALAVGKLRAAVDENYSYRDLRGVDWDAVFNRYRESLLDAASPMEFAQLAGMLLAPSGDKHVWLKVDDQVVPACFQLSTPNANPRLLDRLVPNLKGRNANIYTGRFPDGIGYVFIARWSLEQRSDYDVLYDALVEFADAPGLILDVRCNSGGSEILAREFAGCLVDASKVYAKHVNRDAGESSGFSPVHERILQPNTEHSGYSGKIAVLAGPAVMSSCEAFVLMMKQVPGCVIVGEATQGSSGNPVPYDLGNGVQVYLPSWRAMLPDGSFFEGKGIEPDIHIKARVSDITEEHDPVIHAALNVLRSGSSSDRAECN
ncbi:MAG: hypothetical protein JXR25_03630 [Pontiellaceae bacterium]|nr:hypothetical protein [Pontiellaceae bacterium]MBN2783892.1 hypothetical protein [Pontiellaceae bacterium]